jgi:hypothetical protein
MINKLKINLSINIDIKLVEKLIEFYGELKQKYFLRQYEPSQLNCAKFAEVVMRILEYITKGNYTPFNKNVALDNLAKELEQIPKNKFQTSIRIHIPRILRSVYDIRSKRGVAHLDEVNPNYMDATYVVSACDWIMAEFIRLYHIDDLEKAQKIVDSLVERKVPIIEEFDEDIKVLNTNLSVPDKILVILYNAHPNYVSTDDLKKWIKTKSKSHIPTVLNRLDSDAKIYRRGKENKITIKGIDYIEKNFQYKI